MKVNRKKLLHALNVSAAITSSGGKSFAWPFEGYVLLDGPNQEFSATNLTTFAKVFLEMTEIKDGFVPEYPEPGLLDGLKIAQMKGLAEDYGIAIPDNGNKLTANIIKETILDACNKAAEADKEKFEGQRLCLYGPTLKRILEAMTDEYVTISQAPNTEGVSVANVGENFNNLSVFDWKEYPVSQIWGEPELTEAPESKVQIHVQDLASVASACDRDNGKLDAISFDLESTRAIGTDGRILITAPIEVLKQDPQHPTFLMPKGLLGIIQAMVKEKSKEEKTIQVSYFHNEKGSDVISIKEGDVSIQANQSGRNFPDWKSVVYAPEKIVTIRKEKLKDILRQISAISGPKYRSIKTKFNGGLDIEFLNPDIGTYQKMSIPFEEKDYQDAEEVEVGLDITLIQKAFMACSSHPDNANISIGLKDKAHPLIFDYQGANNFAALVMPLRIV